MRIRYVVAVAAWFVCAVSARSLSGQETEAWRAHFAAGEEAHAVGDSERYASQMAAAARALPAGVLNRPFVQYHAARAYALAGRNDEAVRWLRTVWEEHIESLMISFAPYDPAFEDLVATEAFRGVMRLAESMELDVHPLAEGVYLVQGVGSNVLVQVGEDGVLLVDTGYAPALPALRRALSAIGGVGVDRLIVTHPHEDHMGGSPELGGSALVFAHPGTTEAMGEPYVFIDGVSMPPKPVEARPDVEISTDTTLTFNGDRIRLVPTVAHTAGDVSVVFTGARVAHLGDTYLAGNPMMFPGSDDPDGFLDRLDGLLDSMHPATQIVGGHDGPTDITAVRAQIDISRATMAFVRDAVASGATIEETVAQADGRFAPQWVAYFYGVFTEPPG